MSEDTISFDPTDADADGTDAFYANLTGDKEDKKSLTAPQEDATDASEADPSEGSDDASEGAEGASEAPEEADPNDTDVEIEVGEEKKVAKLSELKKLYRESEALTARTQAATQATQDAETRAALASTALNGLLSRAQERFKPYAELDMLVLAQRMNTEDFEQLRKDAAAAKAEVDYVQHELSGHLRAEQQRQQQSYQAAAAACKAELEDPVKGIKGFGPQLYNEMVTFAVAKGLPEASQLVSPAALKLVHMAMLYERQQATAKAAEAKLKAAPQKPSRVLKGGQGTPEKSPSRDALARLRRTGSTDDATDAFLASFG